MQEQVGPVRGGSYSRNTIRGLGSGGGNSGASSGEHQEARRQQQGQQGEGSNTTEIHVSSKKIYERTNGQIRIKVLEKGFDMGHHTTQQKDEKQKKEQQHGQGQEDFRLPL